MSAVLHLMGAGPWSCASRLVRTCTPGNAVRLSYTMGMYASGSSCGCTFLRVRRAEGGLEAERQMRNKLKEEEDERARKNHEFMMQMRAQGWREVSMLLHLKRGLQQCLKSGQPPRATLHSWVV